MNNPPPYMRSIWLPGYKPRNECVVVNSTPAEAKKNFFNLKPGIKTEAIVRPSTAGKPVNLFNSSFVLISPFWLLSYTSVKGIVKKLKSPFKKENTEPAPVKNEPTQNNKSKRKFDMLESFDEFDSKPGDLMRI